MRVKDQDRGGRAHLFIVARDEPSLFAHLSQEFSGEPGVEVVLDRRQGERRRDEGIVDVERRRRERRVRSHVQAQLRGIGYAFVRLV